MAKRILSHRIAVTACFLALLLGVSTHLRAQTTPPEGYRAYPVEPGLVDLASQALQKKLDAAGVKAEVLVDRENHRLLLRGDQQAAAVADQWFSAAPQPPKDNAVIRAHRAAPNQAEAFAARLQAAYGDRPDVRISADPRTNQILVLADEAVQNQTAALLTKWKEAQVAQPTSAPAEFLERTRTLQHISWRTLESQIGDAYGDRLAIQPNDRGDLATLRVAGLEPANVRVNRSANTIAIEGSAPLVRGWEQIIEALDTPGDQVRIAGVNRAQREDIEKAAGALGSRVSTAESRAGRVLRESRQSGRRWGGDLVAMIFQPENQPENQPADPPPAQAGEQPPATQPPEIPPPGELPQIGAVDEAGTIGPVQIQFVEGLDVIVVRGNKRDVERVLKIIQEIEDLSGQTQPAIEVVPLNHVDSTALTELLIDLYDTILSPRQGRVSIRALVKPNAILLIGRQDSANSLKELIAKLDQPVPPATQFKVFRLKHMSAVDMSTQITTFYEERTGLGQRVRVVPDYRGNAIIVQASPRDLEEIALLVERVDVADSAATKELRVFKLANALAEDLAPVLQDAINGQLIGAGRGANAQGTALQQTQGQQQAQIRSAMLSFLTVDSAGGKLLRSGILFDVRVSADANSNALIVTGPADSMPLIEALVNTLDQLPNASAEIKVFTIVNGDANNLATMLQDLFGQQTGAGNQNAFLQAQAQTAGDSSLVALRFAVDQRTNSIISSGSASDLAVVEAILVRLDEGDIETRKTTVYRLRNAPALDVADAINQLLQGQRQVQDLAPETQSPFEQLEREVIVVPEVVSNSLIVSATPRYFDEIQAVVEQLDARPPMVMIQVLIAEVSLNETDEFGVELGVQDSLLFDRGIGVVGIPFNGAQLGNNADATSLATRDLLAGQALSNLSVGRVNGQLGYGGLVLSAGNESINVLVRALEDRGRMQVLSRPQVMTLDNQPAFVQVGARVPRISSTTQNQQGTVNSVVLENVGILLGVTPRTSPDGLVVMEINAEKSQLGPEAQGIPIFVDNNGNVIRSPQINITTAQTTVSARSGQTVVFAGLITKTQTTARRGTPILSDIPVLGRLFRFDSEFEQRTELLIIMTPFIVNDEQDADYIKQVESDRMSWCLADVVEIHGDAGLSGGHANWAAPEMEVIYPDQQPACIAPEGMPTTPYTETIPAPAAGYPAPSPGYPTPGMSPGVAPSPLPPPNAAPGAFPTTPLPNAPPPNAPPAPIPPGPISPPQNSAAQRASAIQAYSAQPVSNVLPQGGSTSTQVYYGRPPGEANPADPPMGVTRAGYAAPSSVSRFPPVE